MEDPQNLGENGTKDVQFPTSTSLQTVPSSSIRNASYRYIFYAIIGLVLTGSAFVVFAMQSIPGDMLYSAKTNIVEPFALKMHLSNKSKTAYQVTQLKHRLDEIKQLTKKEMVREEDASVLSSHIDRHTATLESLIEASIDSAFPKTEVLFILNDFASVAGAIETIGENDPKLQSIGDTAEDARSASVSLYKKRVLSFVQTEAPTDVYAYIADQLKTVKESLGKNEVGTAITRMVDNYLERVDPAIAKSDLTKVIVSVGEAHRLIAMEAYSGVINNKALPQQTEDATASTSETTSTATTTEVQTTTDTVTP